MSKLRSRLTYANVMATVAMFLALGGGALAATSFIGSDGKITGCVTTKGQLTVVKPGKKCGRGTTKIAWNQQGPRGLQGLQGAPGANGTNGAAGTNGANGTNGTTKVVVRSTTVAPGGAGGGSYSGDIQCDAGERATGGGAGRGAGQASSSTDRMGRSFPLDAAGKEAAGGETPTGWSVFGDTTGLGGNMVIHVVCVSP
jgi:hypothetical protein